MNCKRFDYFTWVAATRIEKPLDTRMENIKLVGFTEIIKEVKVVFVHKKELIATKPVASLR
jgi:hypothetical protein